MAKAFEEQLQMDDIDALSSEERLGLMDNRKLPEPDSRRLKSRLKKAKPRHLAAVENIDYRHRRRLDKSVMVEHPVQQVVFQEYIDTVVEARTRVTSLGVSLTFTSVPPRARSHPRSGVP